MIAQDVDTTVNFLVVVYYCECDPAELYGFKNRDAAIAEYDKHAGKCEERFLTQVLEVGK